MNVYGVITSALVRKFKALLAEIRTLVSEAKQKEQAILATAEGKVAKIFAEAKLAERAVVQETKDATTLLRDRLVAKISNL